MSQGKDMRTYAPVRRLLAAALPPLSRRARAAGSASTVSVPVPASGAGLATAIARGDACTNRVRAASRLHSHATQRIRSSAPVNK